MIDQTEEKKEEGLRGWWVGVSQGFLMVVIGKPKLYQNMWCFTRIGEVSAENTKYAEHYTSYGYSFRIYGYFAEIIK